MNEAEHFQTAIESATAEQIKQVLLSLLDAPDPMARYIAAGVCPYCGNPLVSNSGFCSSCEDLYDITEEDDSDLDIEESNES